MQKFKKKYIFIFIAIIMIINTLITGLVFNKNEQIKNSKELDKLIDSFIYNDDNNDKEISDMKYFMNKNPNLNRRNTAKYNLNLTKLRILDLNHYKNLDEAIDSFIKTQIELGLCEEWDITAWSYADISQMYIDFYTFDIAERCLNKALNYANKCEMDEFFYENCYTTLAMIYARTKRSDLAIEYCNKAVEHDSEDKIEYESMEQRRKIILAIVSLNNGKYDECNKYLNEIKEYISSYEKYPSRILWITQILFPYLEMEMKVSLFNNDYNKLKYYIDEIFNCSLKYNQINVALNLFTNISEIIDKENIVDFPIKIKRIISNNTLKLIKVYPDQHELKKVEISTHMYKLNETNISLLIQKYKMNDLYKIIATISVVVVVVIIVALVYMVKYNEKSSVIDELSKAHNRRYFNKVYKKIKKENIPFGILMYDIDYFKEINDSNGHEIGDKVIKEVSMCVMELLDSNSMLFRYGGDEFCIISRKKNLQEMILIGELIHVITNHMKCAGGKAVITLSIGGASSELGQEIMPLVDKNLYEAKRKGRNCIVVKNS